MMSFCLSSGSEGKDKVTFIDEDDYRKPIDSSIAQIEEEPEEGLITPEGKINWGCPCLGGMATGPCGQEFREAFSCFHYSKEEPKGSECMDAFRKMSECMAEYPDLYPDNEDDKDDGTQVQTVENPSDQQKSNTSVASKQTPG